MGTKCRGISLLDLKLRLVKVGANVHEIANTSAMKGTVFCLLKPDSRQISNGNTSNKNHRNASANIAEKPPYQKHASSKDNQTNKGREETGPNSVVFKL